VRGMVRNWIDTLDDIEVVAVADNGQVALNKVAAAKPDIIILDIEMPIMDGMTALPGLLRGAPNAKVLVASTLSRRNAEVTLKAMALGAADYIAKPSFQRDGNEARAEFRDELLRKVNGLAAPAQTFVAAPAPAGNQSWAAVPHGKQDFKLRAASRMAPRVLAIGSSTGGPAVLTKLFGALKGQLGGVAVLVTQHMPPTFTTLLGESLCRLSGLEGGEATEGEPVVAGRLYVAPGGFHMRVRQRGSQNVIGLDAGAKINHCRPAVDPMFESIANVYRGATLALVLTGMGNDGAAGALNIANGGGSVLAQDETSSVVWGMPGAAMAAGACVGAFGPDELNMKLGRMLGARGKV
jgi:two-component system, chemotaxis family, protein-glutamate methylesterase/glutaminase